MRPLVLWELNRPLVVMTFVAGLVLGFISAHSYYLGPHSVVGSAYFAEPSLSALPVSRAMWHVLTSLPRELFSVYSFVLLLLGSIVFRHDRDAGYAQAIYTLPYRKHRIFLAKLVALLCLTLLLFLPWPSSLSSRTPRY